MSETYKFKIGDRVRCIGETVRIEKGATGTVIDGGPVPWVLWDEPQDNGRQRLKIYWNYLELIEEQDRAWMDKEYKFKGWQEALCKSRSWIPLSESLPTESDADEFGFVMLAWGSQLALFTPAYVTSLGIKNGYWRRTGTPPLPESEAKQAFNKAWTPHQGSHRKECEDWFCKGYDAGNESR